jgi:hypothetical protein
MLVDVCLSFFSPSQPFARFVFRACRVRASSSCGRLVCPGHQLLFEHHRIGEVSP